MAPNVFLHVCGMSSMYTIMALIVAATLAPTMGQDPREILDEHGADALRLYLINSPVVRAETLRFKKEGVFGVVKDVFLPWYNAYRFLVQNVLRLEAETGVRFNPEQAWSYPPMALFAPNCGAVRGFKGGHPGILEINHGGTGRCFMVMTPPSTRLTQDCTVDLMRTEF